MEHLFGHIGSCQDKVLFCNNDGGFFLGMKENTFRGHIPKTGIFKKCQPDDLFCHIHGIRFGYIFFKFLTRSRFIVILSCFSLSSSCCALTLSITSSGAFSRKLSLFSRFWILFNSLVFFSSSFSRRLISLSKSITPSRQT